MRSCSSVDLCAAFDTIYHAILLYRLRYRYDFCEMVLRWTESYLKDRPQCIALDKILSRPRCLSYGVPQGSVPKPLLFSLYIAPLEAVISAHGFDIIMFQVTPSSSFLCVKGTTPLLLKISLCV